MTFDPKKFADGIDEEKLPESSLEEFAGEEEVETSALEAGARSFAQEVTYDFADEIEAGVDTLFSDEGKSYEENLKAVRREYKLNAEKHPVASGVGTVAGLGASLLTGAGAVKLGAKTLGKTGKEASKFLTSGTSSSFAAAGAVQGGLASLGMSEDKSIGDLMKGSIGGAASGAALSKIIPAVGSTFSSGSKFVQERVYSAFGISTKTARKKVDKVVKSRGQSLDDWVGELASTKVYALDESGKLFETPEKLMGVLDGQQSILEKANNNIEALHASRADLLKNIPVKNILGTLDSVKASLTSGIQRARMGEKEVKALQDISDDMTFRFTKIVKSTDNQGVETTPLEDVNLYDLYTLRKSIDEKISNFALEGTDRDVINRMRINARNKLNSLIDSSVESSQKASDLVDDRRVRSELQSLYTLSGALEDEIISKSSSYHTLRDIFIGGMTERATGSKGLGMVVTGLRTASRNPVLNRQAALQSSRFANLLEDKGSEAVHLLNRAAIAAEAGPEILRTVIGSEVAKATLVSQPIGRSVTDVINRQDDILAIAKDENPNLASELETSIRENDTELLAATMDSLSKDPKVGKYIQPGVGFDGMVWNEEDKAHLSSELDGMDISHRQRLELKNNLLHKNIIPQVQQEEDDFLQYMKRDKSKPRY
jgi:hypothetical protein